MEPSALPSYQQATTPPHWLHLVTPYIHLADFDALCLVSRRFWQVFAPLLWQRPLTTARQRGLVPSHDLTWWLGFVFVRLAHVRLVTRQFVRVLDLCHFATTCYQFATDQDARFLRSLHMALKLLPNLNALLLDRHTEIHLSCLVSLAHTHSLLLLSIPHCSTHLPATFFQSSSLQKLVYLDVSSLPGSLTPLLQPLLLPHLRILKLAGRELDDATLVALAQRYQLQLWSLDVSHNRLTDDMVQTLVDRCFPPTSLRSPAHFEVEGKLSAPDNKGSSSYAPFVFITESQYSGVFSHPERYSLDPPTYNAQPYFLHGQRQVFRFDGGTGIRCDSADAAIQMLSPQSTDYAIEDDYRNSRGLTHLDLSYNQISANGIEKLLRTCNGQLEHFACDCMPLVHPRSRVGDFWPKSASLHGIVGLAHMFRPVYSSNLQSLRIHHSLVTNIPTLTAAGLSWLAKLYMAETSVRARIDWAYPQRFVPDMNPRLSSLTLTCVPRRSSGPLIERLVEFLRLLSVQEGAIDDASRAARASSRRWPGMLRGLRHVRIEFECDAAMAQDASTTEELEAQNLLASGEAGFSFFEHENRDSIKPPSSSDAHGQGIDGTKTRYSSAVDLEEERVRGNQEMITHGETWNGHECKVQVWAGSAQPHSNPVVNEYRRLVLSHDSLRVQPGPATPAQVMSGAPAGSILFQAAWTAAVMPPGPELELELPCPMTVGEEEMMMGDVVSALKEYRASGRARYEDLRRGGEVARGAPHFFWTGRLEVSR